MHGWEEFCMKKVWLTTCHSTQRQRIRSVPRQVLAARNAVATLAGESVHMCRTHKLIAYERYLFDSATLTEWEAWCTSHVAQPPAHWSQLQPLPQALTRYKVLLRAFAGRRRKGDIEWFLAQTAAQHDGFILMTVSVDIVIDNVYGDISKQETREFWLHYMRMGYVAGFIAGEMSVGPVSSGLLTFPGAWNLCVWEKFDRFFLVPSCSVSHLRASPPWRSTGDLALSNTAENPMMRMQLVFGDFQCYK